MRITDSLNAIANWLDRASGLEGSEEHAHAEDERFVKEQAKRRYIARHSLAGEKLRKAAKKRSLAQLATERELRIEYLSEARELEEQARRLQEGEIGLLDALGVDYERDEE